MGIIIQKKILVTVGGFVVISLIFFSNHLFNEDQVNIENEVITKETVVRNVASETCTLSLQNTNSKWFHERHDKTIQTLLTKNNTKISEETMEWWLKAQRSKPIDLGAVFNELFHQGMQKNDVSFKFNNACTSCAVVGNSVNLKSSEYGQLIDSHDIVIRFNRAPTKNFEKDVGAKTTHQIMYPESAKALDGDTSFTLLPFKPLDIQWMLSAITIGNITRTYARVPKFATCKVDKITIIHPEFIRYVYVNWLEKHGRYPSTGMMGIVLALQKCDTVDLFGFGADSKGSWHHYWEKLPEAVASGFRKTGVHNGDFERDLIHKLSEEGIIKLHMGK